MRTRLSFLRVIVSCCVLGALASPVHAYNPGPGTLDEPLLGHQWITDKAIQSLRLTDPFAYALAQRYRQQILHGAWYADRNSGTCHIEPIDESFPCDSTNHYDPRFSFDYLGIGVEASVSASEYARDLFAVASDCWKWRNLPEEALPDSCQVPQWRAIDEDLVFGGFEQFEEDGPLIRKSPLALLGWVLHLVQDVTVPHHTFSEPSGGHAGFESNVDAFIRSGKGDMLPVAFSGGPDVSSPKKFVEDIAGETRAIALQFPVAFADPQFPNLIHCCAIPEDEDDFNRYTRLTLNRAIIYSARLLSFYLRKPASDLLSAISAVVID